jgi:hypothetical protein
MKFGSFSPGWLRIHDRHKLSSSDELTRPANQKRQNKLLMQEQTVWLFRDIMDCLSNL